ncbi:MAG: STN and carboxypeptidase regulatory-like domain-containing protein [Bacteroidota bacterium]|nr:STN and carboxypeptidase regulatory-like domain-containing protein [Bacteroidota bacterium]
MIVFKRTIAVFILLVVINLESQAQSILDKNISLEVNRQRLDNVLEIISNKGDFYFSYNSNIIKRDSLVTLTVYNKTIKKVLDFLFSSDYEFKESGNYIIIRRAPLNISRITNKALTEDKIYTVSGYVLDDETGQKLSDASIYDKHLLASALTDENGYFKIKLKSKNKTVELTVSKEFYQDTTIVIEPRYNQQLTITIMPQEESQALVTVSPNDYYLPDSLKVRVEDDSTSTEYLYVKKDSSKLEKTAIGNFLLSSKQKIQSLNLKKFFTERPFQVSVLPGMSTHGRLSPQIVNNFSLNIFGGYTGGLNGVEFGGLFNLDKRDVRFFQAAGLFNLTGGNVTGAQFAGINNTVINNLNGWQTAGIYNYTKGKVNGWQLAGIHNHAADTARGVQIAGISNYANKNMKGLQIAGIGNFSRRKMNGMQVAGIFNYAKNLHGVQIGLINVSDTSSGYSIGLLNLVNKGYHKISLYANETMNANLNIKTGNSKLYSMLMGGINLSDSAKIYSFGFGLGHDFIFSNRFSFSTELSSQYLYLGSWSYTNLLNKFSLNLNVHLNKNFALFAGPAFNVYYSNQAGGFNGFNKNIPSAGYHHFNFSPRVNGWIGWNAGITLF